MIKVNYNETTGKVIGFDKAMTPYIEITEEQRRQPLPDKYSYYAVENGEFVIKRRTPSEAETKADSIASIKKSDVDITTNISEDGMRVSKGGEVVLTANNGGVEARNLHATTYLIIGENSRFEDYDNGSRTGCFWIRG